ncbi:unnamed protein product [Dibothriocephalus latus]|uniref:Uncharacterized protein n=1 Tax=Dibothriocephalus latus TaxID=60516 RepID=A0A3P7LE71_DIBLA|nr:unnamed protein product [Dibothriocephalus latus]
MSQWAAIQGGIDCAVASVLCYLQGVPSAGVSSSAGIGKAASVGLQLDANQFPHPPVQYPQSA